MKLIYPGKGLENIKSMSVLFAILNPGTRRPEPSFTHVIKTTIFIANRSYASVILSRIRSQTTIDSTATHRKRANSRRYATTQGEQQNASFDRRNADEEMDRHPDPCRSLLILTVEDARVSIRTNTASTGSSPNRMVSSRSPRLWKSRLHETMPPFIRIMTKMISTVVTNPGDSSLCFHLRVKSSTPRIRLRRH